MILRSAIPLSSMLTRVVIVIMLLQCLRFSSLEFCIRASGRDQGLGVQ